MRVSVPLRQDRGLDAAMFADITTLTVTWIGGDEQDQLCVDFAGDLTADQVAAVQRRLLTRTTAHETLYARGLAALETNRTFRDTTSDQLLAGAQVIIDDATVTQAEAVVYIKDLARAVRALTNHVEALSQQNIGLVRLAQDLLDWAD